MEFRQFKRRNLGAFEDFDTCRFDWLSDDFFIATQIRRSPSRRKLRQRIRHIHCANADFNCHHNEPFSRGNHSIHWTNRICGYCCAAHCTGNFQNSKSPDTDSGKHPFRCSFIADLRYRFTNTNLHTADKYHQLAFWCAGDNLDNIEEKIKAP